ncbi:MAG: glycosyltransferase [Clostridia bacterium]|nr:glycosyltransferase [Clostridia bacterium]
MFVLVTAPRLSLCMIVRNEAPHLARCLASVQGLVDEIIVVDTGSADETPLLARQWGARVYFEPWQDDFSLARNASLSRASGAWILVLDADEELAGGREALPALLAAPEDVEGYFVTIESPTADGPGAQVLRHLNLRLFRRRPEYRFSGAIHEQILPSILAARPQTRLPEAPLVIRHYGYLAARSAAKTARNRAILERALGARPDDPFLRYNLGVTRYQSGDFQGALELFWPLFHRLSPQVSYYASLVRSLAVTLLEAGDARQALTVTEKGCQQFPDYADLFYLRGLALKRLGRYAEAIQVLEELSRMPAPPSRYLNTCGVNGPLGQVLLGQIYEELGERRRAARAYLAALEQMPEQPEAAAGLVRLLRGRGLTGEKLAEALQQLLPAAQSQARAVLLQALVAEGEGRAMLALLPPAEDPVWQSADKHRWQLLVARGRLQAGQWREALRAALKVRPPARSYAEALRLAALAASLGERRKLTRHLLRRLQVAGEVAASLVWRAYALYLWGAAVDPQGVQLNRADRRQQEEAWLLFTLTLETASRRHAAAALRLVSLLAGEISPLRLGHLYYRYGWTAEAADCYLKALEAKTVDESMCLAMGSICTARGLYKEAATFYQQAVELNPSPANNLLLVEARLREACALLAEGQRFFPASERLAALREMVDVSLERLSRGDG